MLGAIGMACALAVFARRRARNETLASILEAIVGVAYLVMWVGTFVWLRVQPGFDPATDRPLQLCHWAAVAAALALIAPRRAFGALAYFWGLALCTQALVTPSLTEGPATWPFWFFWTTHALCVGVPLYDVLARGYRPRWRHYALACAAAALYVAVVLPVDIATGWNYGFVGPTRPGFRSVVDVLGPWPLRLVWIALIAAAAMALAMLPFTRTRAPSPPARPA
jgi:hypothetical integral membrane protein (TIGR02206 family)